MTLTKDDIFHKWVRHPKHSFMTPMPDIKVEYVQTTKVADELYKIWFAPTEDEESDLDDRLEKTNTLIETLRGNK